MTTATLLDETLLKPRRILRSEPDPVGFGHYLQLECGHSLWSPVQPRGTELCGMCLERLVRQIRDVQLHQEAV
jgi:hypothetical protein